MAVLLLVAAAALCLPAAALGQSYEVLHAFTADGGGPQGPLIQASDGNLYGTTTRGGTFDQGTVFRIDSAGNLTTLHSFTESDASPSAGLIQATDGDFYGTTSGTVFKMDLAGNLTTLHSFTGSDGAGPNGVIQATDGNFYGTTYYGGTLGNGTVFKMDSAGNVTTLHSFAGNDGASPHAGLIQATDGNFYGTTSAGGGANAGTVFKTNSSGNLTTLHSFAGPPNDGSIPYAGLIQATDGNFYGTTGYGGNSRAGGGTVFKMDKSGKLTTIHNFGYTVTDGVDPLAGLVQAIDGNFYGTTYEGGVSNVGTVFKMDSSGNLTTLYGFAGNSGGFGPAADLIQAADGNFYSTTTSGGTSNLGTVFKMGSSGNLTTLQSFGYTDGAYPDAALIQASDGNFYGTTYSGGTGLSCRPNIAFMETGGCGTVFKMHSAGNVTTLYSFTGGSDGSHPTASLIQASDGNFYGTTAGGGASNYGTVFRMDSLGNLTTLHSFAGSPTDGAYPLGLVQAIDGNFYGTTVSGGTSNYGTVFKMDSAGNLTTLYSFTGGSDGANPAAGLIQATDGNFYGTTFNGGASNFGTVFKMDSAGTLTTLHSLVGSPSEGASPSAGVIQATDGDFYGTTAGGGAGSCIGGGGCGTVFKVDSAGDLTTLYSFGGFGAGVGPSGLIQATDGNFYGTTFSDGAPAFRGRVNGGTVFKMDPAGNLTTLHDFEGSDVSAINAGLISARDGSFYGTAGSGGSGGGGVIFRLTLRVLAPRVPKPPPPRLVPFRPVDPAHGSFGAEKARQAPKLRRPAPSQMR